MEERKALLGELSGLMKLGARNVLILGAFTPSRDAMFVARFIPLVYFIRLMQLMQLMQIVLIQDRLT